MASSSPVLIARCLMSSASLAKIILARATMIVPINIINIIITNIASDSFCPSIMHLITPFHLMPFLASRHSLRLLVDINIFFKTRKRILKTTLAAIYLSASLWKLNLSLTSLTLLDNHLHRPLVDTFTIVTSGQS